MIKLKDILFGSITQAQLKFPLPEAFADTYEKNKWIQLPKDVVKTYADEIIDIIVSAYTAKGGNFEFKNADDIKKSELDFWIANDIDVDPEIDAIIGGKTTPAGIKMTVFGQDGSSAAKKVGMIKMIDYMKKRGFYAEVDIDLAAKLGVDYIKDEALIRKVLNKDIKMNVDGSYSRKLTDGPVKTKVLIGIPKV